MDPHRLAELDRARRRREVVRVAASILVGSTLLLVVYYMVPLGGNGTLRIVALLLVGGLAYVAAVNRQLRKVAVASLPGLQAIQGVVLSVLLFLVLFATVYLAMAAATPGSFSEQLTHSRALYFAVTVLSTVGFGDITPRTDTASMVVSVQMLLDLVLVGAVVRSFVFAARARLPVRDGGSPGPTA
jgi:voltage-gated potassium channel